ncbi:MAG: hypothetical protein MZV64_29685 [Ignavibacteriales bacterium]|nr:hypothetical protein [Ignavibacteriales bacterium]
MTVAFGVICARKNGSLAARLDTRSAEDHRGRRTLPAGLRRRGHEREQPIDPGEDLNLNGRLDHHLLPQPPRPPKVRAEVEDQGVSIYWDKSAAELSVDPVTHLTDFEGYRIYRSNAGEDFTNPEDLLLYNVARRGV